MPATSQTCKSTPQGIGHLDAPTDHVTISAGAATLFDTTAGAVGSAFIIHANEDDQVTDAGNGGSGARIACGVISRCVRGPTSGSDGSAKRRCGSWSRSPAVRASPLGSSMTSDRSMAGVRPGALFGAVARLERRGLIEPVAIGDRHPAYRLSGPWHGDPVDHREGLAR